MTNKNEERSTFMSTLIADFGERDTYSRAELVGTSEKLGQKFPHWCLNKDTRVARNEYAIPSVGVEVVRENKPTSNVTPIKQEVPAQPAPTEAVCLNIESMGFNESLIPHKDPKFVQFGEFKLIKQVIKSGMFFPVSVTGLSGNGKTHGIEQACAQTQREVIRVNFTIETDEDDLIGGFRLVNGETKFFKGPVISAMERGAILLCDEIDLANPARVMCLQSILEGGGYFIKKTGEYITPMPGFNIIATGNTKGKGSEDGQFIGTNVMNEAFLERFPITIEQEYPSVATEKRIIKNEFTDLGLEDDEFITNLVTWADIIRKTYADDAVDEIISTRRLVHISRAYSIMSNKMSAIKHCINRFDDETKSAFLDLYTKIDAGALDTDNEPFNDEASF